jgi:hypothetical protein
MVYLGIDPSFSKTGVCYFDDEEKTILFKAISPDGTNDSYKKALDRSGYIALHILNSINMKKEVYAIIEEPLMSTFKASRLGILSGVLVWSLAFMPSIKKIYSLTPTYISRTNKDIIKKLTINKKQASIHVVSAILEFLQTEGYQVTIINDKVNKDGSMKARRLSHDEAESFILTLTLLIKRKVFNDEIINKIYEINPGLTLKANIILLKGEF